MPKLTIGVVKRLALRAKNAKDVERLEWCLAQVHLYAKSPDALKRQAHQLASSIEEWIRDVRSRRNQTN